MGWNIFLFLFISLIFMCIIKMINMFKKRKNIHNVLGNNTLIIGHIIRRFSNTASIYNNVRLYYKNSSINFTRLRIH